MRLWCLLAASIFSGAAVLAQEYRGTLLGRVSDASGAVVPDATVSAVNQATNVTSATRTTGDGNFLVTLEPGAYTLSVDAVGFKRSVHSGIVVHVADRLTVNVELQVGSVGESVTVLSEAPLLETTHADISQVVDRRFLDLLYVPNRNPLNMVSLSPGVSETASHGFTDSSQHSFSIHGGGATAGNNEIIVDGASVVMPRQGGSIAGSPSGDNVEELRIQTTMFDAGYSRSNGGVVTYATRGGANRLHGSFEGFYRNKALEANGWTNNRNGLPRAEVDRKFYSGAIGGPVYLPKLYDGHNRTFFFFSMQREDITNAATFLGRVPTDLERRGDFSQTLNTRGGRLDIYNPFSTVVTGAAAARAPFSDNRIPASLLNPAGSAIANAYPMPNQSVPAQLGLNNWGINSDNQEPARQTSIRIDQSLSPRHRIFGRLALMNDSHVVQNLPPGLELSGEDIRHYFTVGLSDDFTFSPTFLATFRYGFGRYSSDTAYTSQRQDPSVLKIPEILTRNALFGGWPRIRMAEQFAGFGGRVKYRANDTHSLVPTFTKLAGSHNVRFGADLRLVNWNAREPGYDGAGSFTFNNTFTRSDPFTASSGNTTGTSLASLLLGVPATGNFGGNTPFSLRHYYYAGFVQDDWKVTSRLTLNFGLRYEIETPYRERYDRLTYGFDYTSANPVRVPGLDLRGGLLFAGNAGNPRWQGRWDRNNFGPRFGLAWQIRPTTVLRAGYGLFYSSNTGNLDTSVGVPPTYSLAAPYVGTVDGGATPFTTLSNPYPNGLPPVLGNSAGLASRIGNSVDFIDQGRVLPYTQQMQFSVQQTLPSKIRLEIAFINMLSVKGLQGFNRNEVPDRFRPLGAEENRRVPNPFFGLVPADSTLGSSSTVVQRQLWLAYPQFTGVSVNGANTRTTTYHSLEVSVDKRLSHGLTLIANYTGSKMIESNITSLVNTRHYRGISGLDDPHIANLAFVYDLPFGKGRALLGDAPGVAGKIISGWSASGRLYLAGGHPLSFTDSNGRPIRIRNAAKSGPVGDRLGDRVDPATRQVLNPYFDTTAFQSLPNQYTISPEPPYFSELRAPGKRTIDMSLIKSFSIGERLNLGIRADATNLTNTPQFDPPGTDLASKATFGVIQTAGRGRSVQFAFRAVF